MSDRSPKPTLKPNPVRQLRRHRGSGFAYTRVNGRDVYLGGWGSPKAQRAYAELLDELARFGGVLPFNEATTTTEMVLDCWT
ncbi:MAG: hypothetical protein AAFY08_09970 [Planctomycetota bacterium]